MKYTVIVASLVCVVACSSSGPEESSAPAADSRPPVPETSASIPDAEIGLAPGTAFEQPAQAPIPFSTVDPGDSELRARPNAEFPPVIPHSVEDLGPISVNENPCLDCHDADVAEDMGAVAIPPSHRMDLRNSPEEVGDSVTGARLVCTSCHVSQTGAELAVVADSM